jgi:hypothetical protein
MAFQSVWYYTDLPEDIVDIIERDVSETFDEQMGDSKLHGDALNKEKRNSQNAWIPTTHWVGGFLWHYIQRVMCNCWMKQATLILFPVSVVRLYCLTPAHNTEF